MEDFGGEAVAAPEPSAAGNLRPNEGSSCPSADESERVRKLLQLLDEWMADESGHDEEMWPKLKAVLEQDRISSRPLFREDSD
jgi:hypothetical protein